MRRRCFAAALLIASGCTIGPGRRFETAREPEGAKLEAKVAGSAPLQAPIEVRGELLEVRKDALLVLGTADAVVLEGSQRAEARRQAQQREIVLLPFGNVLKARFDKLGSGGTLEDRQAPTARAREKLRLVSRFPQGLALDLLSRLLAAHGQTEARRLGP